MDADEKVNMGVSSSIEYVNNKLVQKGYKDKTYSADGEIYTDLPETSKEAISKGLKIGDTVTGYTLDSSKSSTTTSGKENTAKLKSGSTYEYEETNNQPQTVNQTAYSTWKYIGISENGEILIAPDMPTSGTVNTMKLLGKGGYLNGPAELNTVCNALYSTDKGTARSMNEEDIRRILNYTGPKGTYYDEEFEAITSPEAKKISDIGTLTYTETPDDRPIGDYYSFYYSILKTSDEISPKIEIKDFVFTTKYYWLASSCCVASMGASYAAFGMRYVHINAVNFAPRWNSTGEVEAMLPNSVAFAVRPVVNLKSNVQLVKQSNRSWKIN